jgi:hypothetical protein
MNQETRQCRNCKNQFTIEPDDFTFYEKIGVPAPTLCPDCRRQRRLAYRNDFVFYNRVCGSCGRNVISLYSPENPQLIYCNKCWWSDKWDPKSYGRDFDFNRPFFDQFAELKQKVPALALVNDNGIGSENCEYVQNVQYSKNCYMAMVSWKLENCMYFSYGAEAKDCVDCMGIFDASEGLYESMYCSKCFGSKHIRNSAGLVNCLYCYDCSGCEDCFMCVGLRNKKYCFKNEEYSKEEYEKIVSSYGLDTRSGSERAGKEFEEFLLTKPHKYAWLKNCVNCVGDNLTNGKNVRYVFHVQRAEDCKYLENGDTEKDSYDLCVGGELSECYEGLTPDHSNRALFTMYTWKSMNVAYCDFCMSSKNCFGCVGLKYGEYSILNKQYSKEEYIALKDKILDHMKKTGEWGEFFSMKHSPFAYNETMAQLSFPMTKEQATKNGLRWQDTFQVTKGKTTKIEVPDNISDVRDSITEEILECAKCGRNYKIIPDELVFHRKWKIPAPRNCFFCRIGRRFELRAPSHVWMRKCQCAGAKSENGVYQNTVKHGHGEGKCPNAFETSYAPERKEIVYCESCYNSEIV